MGGQLYKFLTVLIFGICTFILFNNKGFFNKPKSELIISDGHGYYAYLPAVFIHHDLNFNFIAKANQDYYSENTIPAFYVDHNDKKINKYYVGPAILMFPFFAVAHLLTKLSNQPADGYSLYYQYFIALGALFYMFIGIFFLKRIFDFLKINFFLSSILLLGVVFGTNLYHYVIFEPAMSHVYSFSLISAYLYFLLKAIRSYHFKNGLIVVALLGLIFLCRPTNLLIILITPIFFTNFSSFYDWLSKHLSLSHLLIYIPAFILVVSIQCLYWYNTTGLLYFDSYKYEGFIFGQLHIIDFLFSFKKGFFIYTPFFLSLFIAIVYLFKKSPFKAWVFLIFFFIVCYILSSWWSWYYGGSFGMRALIDFYPLLCLVISMSLTDFTNKKYFVLMLFTAICAYMNIVQEYQYRNYILHWDCMDREKYFKIFLKTDDQYKGVLFYDNTTGNLEKYHQGKLLYQNDCNFNESNNDINFVAFKILKNQNKIDSIGYVNAEHEYSTGFQITTDFIENNPNVIIKTYSKINIEKESSAELVISLEKNGKIKSWQSKVIPNFIEDKTSAWYESKYHTLIYGVENGDILKCYLHFRSGKMAMIDNLHLKIYEYQTKK
jgi:hypothetical protein